MICNGCQIDKEATQANFAFRNDAQCLRHTCRDCQRNQRKARCRKDEYGEGDEAYWRYLRRERLRARRSRKKNPEINREATARWRAKNREKSNALARAYRARRGAQYMKEWRARNKDWYNAYMRDWNKLNKLKTRLCGLSPTELINLVASIIPPNLATEIKDEVTQELLTRVLSGEVRISRINEQVKPLITKFYRDYANRGLLSLDAPVGGYEDLTLGQVIEG